MPVRLLAALSVALAMCPRSASAEVFQHELLAASNDWVVVRENIPASAADTAACGYPRLDPSEHAGVRVHFIRLPTEAGGGRLVPLAMPGDSTMLYTPAGGGKPCTSRAEAGRRWAGIAARATSLGINLSEKVPDPVVLGAAVPAKVCVLIAGTPTKNTQCRRVFRRRLPSGPVKIAVSLTAVPEAPDKQACQFAGHRFGVAIQIAGRDFGTMESQFAPGGFATRYDCRGQQFNPLRLYVLGRLALLLGGFRGDSIADRDEYPFLILFPAQPLPE